MPEMDREIEILRGYELRLLRCTLPPPPPSDSAPHSPPSDDVITTASHRLRSLITDLLVSIETGRYLQALRSPDAARLVFKLTDSDSAESIDDTVECAERVYSEFLNRVESFLSEGEDDKGKSLRVVIVTSMAVAAFLGFTQSNMTGPIEGLPKCPLPLIESNDVDKFAEWDNWARNQVMSSGSDLLGKFSNLQYIVFAKMFLMRTKDLLSEGSISSRSISWWLARVLLTQQRILDDRCSSLFDLLHVFTRQTLHHFGTLEKLTSYWGASLHKDEGLAIVSMLHLEAGIMEYTYGRVDSCRLHFESAEAAAGLELSVTGVLGFRTVYQVEPKAQMVLVANGRSWNSSENCESDSSGPQKKETSSNDENYEASDILITPKLLENDNGHGTREGIQVGGTAAPLSAIHQAVILAKCLLIEKSTRHDDMQKWDMAPYIEAINSQQSSGFALRFFCDTLRIRWESTRNRTKERALMMMDKLVQGLYEPSPGVAQRIPLCHGVCIPTIANLRKEYGELLVRCGLVGEAIKIYEDLELWDNLILCYRLLKKKAAAVDVIKARLSVMPNDPRLWCSLGDFTNNDACYEKALEVSNNRSARAKRALALSAYNRGEYETSVVLWESAMALNSMYPDGWFALGSAALKAKEVEKALDGFTRAVQLEPENGEAWNNIACFVKLVEQELWQREEKGLIGILPVRDAAEAAAVAPVLSQGDFDLRNSWQLWENYGHVALDVENISQAIEAVRMVLETTGNKRVECELLERIMTEVEKKISGSSSSTRIEDPSNQVCLDDSSMAPENESSVESGNNRSRETEQLVDFFGKVLQRAVLSGNGVDTWGLYARWHKLKGDLTMCSEALLKQVRSYQGSDLWNDRDQFRKFARASLELCRVYMEISSSTGSRRELFTAEMHLKSTIKQATAFSDMEEVKDLQACLEAVQTKLQSNSTPM
ncbi:N-terminal acetyltransferase A, auxiliary subunit [Parasponia andersonii]|uniref:N-terminal acetyltransferase A, auxiliary subunit n=1 Tax=Parasponia andersonii TaxID=3476 RepID=A0A2P5CLF5_PARAD|nr:N-terminal acetyltransferase A, auxiliary subunit [Parasponia andersonii]